MPRIKKEEIVEEFVPHSPDEATTLSTSQPVEIKYVTKLDLDFGRADLNLLVEKINQIIEKVNK